MTYLYLKTKSCVAFNALGYLIRLLSYDAFSRPGVVALLSFSRAVSEHKDWSSRYLAALKTEIFHRHSTRNAAG